jgi:hypothetical protein
VSAVARFPAPVASVLSPLTKSAGSSLERIGNDGDDVHAWFLCPLDRSDVTSGARAVAAITAEVLRSAMPRANGWIPRGHHDSIGRRNSWRQSSFLANRSGRCRVCGEPIAVGDWIQTHAGGGVQHPRCAQGPLPESPSTAATKAAREETERPTPHRSSTNAPASSSTQIPRIAAPQRPASTGLPTAPIDKLRAAGDLAGGVTIGLVAGNVACPTCNVLPHRPCIGGGAKWVHGARVSAYLQQVTGRAFR